MFFMKEEIWKQINGYRGWYEISNLGNIKSLPKWQGCVLSKERILKPMPTKHGYMRVCLSNSRVRKKFISVHRIVATHFIGVAPKNKPWVNHKNGIKKDNRAENLEWSSISENINHAIDNKLRISIRGEKSNFSKLTEKEVLEIRAKYPIIKSYKKLASMYSISISAIGHIITKKNWVHI